LHARVKAGELSLPAVAAEHRRQKRKAERSALALAPAAGPSWRVERADCLAFFRRQLADSIDLVLDAFGVPMQNPGGAKAEHRMLYTGILYTPDKGRALYLVDFELDLIAGQMREAAKAYGLGEAGQLIAISDAGNGLEGALHRHFHDDMLCILDWYHAAGHLHEYARCLHPGDDGQAQAWSRRAKDILYEEGGTALLAHLRAQPAPAEAGTADELRKLVEYFANNEHRADYPSYREHGWDIGSGPTEAACKVVGARLKQSGMRWVEEGAARVAPLRALYLSGADVWDAFWALAG
jgi:hypothetical protein